MNPDPATMSLMVSIASILHSTILIFFFLLANQYRGIGVYAVGSIFSALGFLSFLLRSLQPEFLFLRFLGNSFVVLARIFYVIGIGQFVRAKKYSFFWIFLSTIFLLSQVYFVYINGSNYFLRNFSICLTLVIIYSIASHSLLEGETTGFSASTHFTTLTFIGEILFLIFRIVSIRYYQVHALFESSLINTLTFLSTFIFDYLRNAGFMMMVSQRLYRDLHNLANLDFLTNTLNRRSMQKHLNQEISRFRRSQIAFSLILLDIDHFKAINDTYGHDGGDLVLKDISKLIRENLRSYDVLSRWGGEEFLILLPQTLLDEASCIAERLRVAVETQAAVKGSIHYTISLGVGTWNKESQSIEHLITAVDTALYQAKNQGRNRVVIAHKTMQIGNGEIVMNDE